jgi:hypothetical protein
MRLGAVAVLLVVLAPACSEPVERKPATCEGCGAFTGGGIGVPPAAGGSSGTGGGKSGAAGAESAVTLTGNVILIDDFALKTGPLLDDPATLRAEAKGGGNVTGNWNGMDPFVIEDVLSDPFIWVHITPSSASVALPTLVPMNTAAPAAGGTVTQNLGVVSSLLIDTILNVLTVPVFRDPSKGILVLEVRKADGTPRPGVTVTAPTAETVVYGAAGTFTDDATQTDNSGLVLLVNVPASAWPGTLIGVTFTGALEGGADVRSITGSVTFEGIQ